MKEDLYRHNSNSSTNLLTSNDFDNDSSATLLPSGPNMPGTVTEYGATANLDALQADRPGYGTASTMGSCFQLVNAMMGSGIIGLPLALRLCGLWMGLLCSIAMAGLTAVAMQLLILSGIRCGQYTLADLTRVSMLGSLGSHVVNCLMVFHTAGTVVSYYILLGDMLPELFQDYGLHWLADRRGSVIIFGLLCNLPLCLPRSIAPLAKWSTFNVMLLPIVLLGVFIRMPVYATTPPSLDWVWPTSNDLFTGLAILGLSFGCSQNVFGIYLSQRDQRPSQFLLADTSSVLIGYVINMTFAVMGYLCFGDHVKANVLLNFPSDDTVINIVRLALCIFMIFTIPMSIYPCREALQKLLGYNTHGRIPSNKEHYGTTGVVFVVVLYLGATLTALGKVFAVIGGFTTTALGLLLPGAAYMALFLPELIMRDSQATDVAACAQPHQKVVAGYAVSGSWLLVCCSCMLVFVSIPIMYFAVADAL
ncbi:transmembrane amino acid transporter protein-domain-containing protein [Fennellomyces sp. T-0311]|nr:transmembrane amino acid transporter protein-domain-containing protein [Fennellomyces sp. T-0311]